jgi:hypothetical protein
MHGTVAPNVVHVQYFQSRCRKPSRVPFVSLFKQSRLEGKIQLDSDHIKCLAIRVFRGSNFSAVE